MDGRTVVRADAVFEAALGLALVLGAATGGMTFPNPAGPVAVAVAGGGLFFAAAVLWRLRIGLVSLAAANVASALVLVAWLAAATGFSTAGAALLGAAVAGLVALAAAELALAREPATGS